MTDPKIFRSTETEYRPLTSTSQGWLGFPNGGWSLRAESTTRPTGGPGSFKPGPTNTGVTSSRERTVYAGTRDLTVANQVFRNIDFYGNIRCLATGLKFYNCGFYGGTNWPKADTALVESTYGVDSNTLELAPWRDIPYFEDCTFKAQRPTYYTDGILGSFHLVRCNISNVRNGAMIQSASDEKRVHVRVESSYIHHLVFWYPVPSASALIHCIDVRTPGDIYIGGNYLEGSVRLGNDRNFNDPDGAGYPGGAASGRFPAYIDHLPHVPGGGLYVRNDRYGFDKKLVIEKNWFAKGLVGADLGAGNYVFDQNVFEKDDFYWRRANNRRYHTLLDYSANVEGTNRFSNGEALSTTNGGIYY